MAAGKELAAIKADPAGLAKPPPAGGPARRAAAWRHSGGPIFLLGIQRGGTNQVLNILRSHPATSWPEGEFHEVFRPRGLRARGRSGRCASSPLRADLAHRRRHPRPRPAAAARGAARRGARPGGRRRARALGRANRASVAAYKAELRRQGCLRRHPPPDRMLAKALNYNLAFVPDLLAL